MTRKEATNFITGIMTKHATILFFLLLASVSSLFASGYQLDIQKESETSLTLQITFDAPQKVNVADGSDLFYWNISGLDLVQEVNTAVVPFLSQPFSLRGERVSYRILSQQTENLETGNYLVNQPDGATANSKPQIQVTKQGTLRGAPLFSLTVFPIRINPTDQTVSFTSRLVVELTVEQSNTLQSFQSVNRSVNESKLLQSLLLNQRPPAFKIESTISQATAGQQPYVPGRFKILIDEQGLYKITYDDLVEADYPVGQVDTRKLRLLNRGREIPLYFNGGGDGSFDSGDYFEFWAEEYVSDFVQSIPDMRRDPFNDTNVYWLEQGTRTGLRIVEESGALSSDIFITPFAFTETIHFENDAFFEHFGQSGANLDQPGYLLDHWYFDSGISAVGSRTYPAFLPYPLETGSNEVYVTAMMRGKSYYNATNPISNHMAELWLNDRRVGIAGAWSNQNYHVIKNDITNGISQKSITHGENEIRVIMDQPGVSDIILMNWFDITYQRKYRAYENTLHFKKQDQLPEGYVYQFEVDGFDNPDIEVYKLGISKLVNGRTDEYTDPDNFRSYRVTFQDEIFYPDIEYVAITEAGKKKPLAIIEDLPWKPEVTTASLLTTANRAEYLIITEERFYSTALELKDYREQNGLTVEVVKVEDIYDEFNYGSKSPLAIREFLRYVYRNWDQSKPLLYVTLAGDAAIDYRHESDYVPTFLFETIQYGASASDHQYALMEGDDEIPDIIVARIPASSSAQLGDYMDKMIAFEGNTAPAEWRNRGLFISGNDAGTYDNFSNEPAFRGQNQRLINYKIPQGYFARKLNTIRDDSRVPYDPNFGGTTDLINYIDDGVSLINFLGHGGGGIWADVQLMNLDDIDRLNNGVRLPFVKSMTCFTGAFENVGRDNLAEKLVIVPERGAIGILASSGVGWVHNDFAVGWALTEFLFEPGLSMGAAMLKTKIYYLSNNVYVAEDIAPFIPDYYRLKYSMVNQYNLLGEPLVHIGIPESKLQINVDNSNVASGDTISVVVSSGFNGSGRAELTDKNHEVLQQQFFSMTNSSATLEFNIPADLEDQFLYVKAYAEDGVSEGRGILTLAIDQALLDSVQVEPGIVSVGDSVYFNLFFDDKMPLSNIRLVNMHGGNGRYYYNGSFTKNGDYWRGNPAFGPVYNGDIIYYDVQATDTSGQTYLFREKKFTVRDPRPDLSICADSFRFLPGDRIRLAVDVENTTENNLGMVEISFYTDQLDKDTAEPFYTTSVNLEGYDRKTVTVEIDATFLVPGKKFIAYVDPGNAIVERNEYNNIDSSLIYHDIYNVTVTEGSTDTLSLGSFVRMYIPANAFSANTTLSYSEESVHGFYDKKSQPDFRYALPAASIDSLTAILEMGNPSVSVVQPLYLEFRVDTLAYTVQQRADMAICRYEPSINRWVRVNGFLQGSRLSAQINRLGKFALFISDDDQPPQVEISVNGRTLYDEMLVPQNPNLAILLQDANGIDLENGVELMLNGQPVPADEISVPDSTDNPNSVSVLIAPKIAATSHDLYVKVLDTNGNTKEIDLNFAVADGFNVEVYGNYPNPFEDETIISFDIVTGPLLDEFSIKIYTVSGRLIRTFYDNEHPNDNLRETGYHEVLWDGMDDNGYIVANGVYFAVIKAVSQGESVEKILKLAKLK
jgi:hypothetical protein